MLATSAGAKTRTSTDRSGMPRLGGADFSPVLIAPDLDAALGYPDSLAIRA